MNERQKQILATRESYFAPDYDRFQFEASWLFQMSGEGIREGSQTQDPEPSLENPSGINLFRPNDF